MNDPSNVGALHVTVVAATCERGADVLNFGGGAYAFAWRDPGRMSGSMLSNTCAGVFLFLLTYLAQHVEVLWR
ncbi:hypothetical protein AB0F71_31285 [Kitasatospora sp. NPDC028055]|uniref:hypothetical protein n=1 Tax=Kitasatospora sp. NPDC028055 TaxID=3155653 RepID=UPI0033E27E60